MNYKELWAHIYIYIYIYIYIAWIWIKASAKCIHFINLHTYIGIYKSPFTNLQKFNEAGRMYACSYLPLELRRAVIGWQAGQSHSPAGIRYSAGRRQNRWKALLHSSQRINLSSSPTEKDNHKPDQLHVKSSCYHAVLPFVCRSHYSNRCCLNPRHSPFDGHSVACVSLYISYSKKV